MSPEQVEAAVKVAEAMFDGYLCTASGRLQGKQMYRYLLHKRTLSRIADLKRIDDGLEEMRWMLRSNFVLVFGEGGLTYDDEKGERLIALAHTGDDDADAVLRDIAVRFVYEGCALPPHLREYIIRRLRAIDAWPKRRGRKAHANARRNISIARIVAELIRRGFAATRNEGTEAPSACSITADALKRAGLDLSEHAVSKIWADYAQFID